VESQSAIGAIYDMREAAEQKARAEVMAALRDTPENRNSLLDAQIELEIKTQDAIEAATEHHCSSGCVEHRERREDAVLENQQPAAAAAAYASNVIHFPARRRTG
jgi:hypothetical protein